MNFTNKVLERFGLSENETKVYLQVVKDGETSPYKLSQETGIARTTVYEIVTSLSLKGLIELEKSEGLMKQQTKLVAKDPSVLRSILWQRRDDLTVLEADLIDILPQLKGDYFGEAANADFHFYPGIEGAKKVYFSEAEEGIDLPQVGWDYLFPADAFGSPEINADVQKETSFRKKSKSRIRELVPLNDWTRHVLTYQYGLDPSYIKVREIRFIDNPVFSIKQRMSVKGNRVRIICIEEGESWGIVINSPVLAKSLLSMFELMWQMAVAVSDEVVKGWGENRFLAAQRKKN